MASFDMDLLSIEDAMNKAMEWFTLTKRSLVESMSENRKPFTKPISEYELYIALGYADWGQIVAARGLDTAKDLARKFAKMSEKYGPPDALGFPGQDPASLSPHPLDV